MAIHTITSFLIFKRFMRFEPSPGQVGGEQVFMTFHARAGMNIFSGRNFKRNMIQIFRVAENMDQRVINSLFCFYIPFFYQAGRQVAIGAICYNTFSAIIVTG